MDIYAQPHATTPMVWIQQAPHDPRRRSLGVFGIQTGFSGKHDYDQLGGVTTHGFHPSSTQTGSTSNNSKKVDAKTSGISLIDIESLPPSLYATGDVAEKDRNAGNSLAGVAFVDEIARINDQRLKLLAVRYEQSNTSAEILARLAILDTRLTEKAPRVSKAQLDVLEKNLDLLANLRKNREVVTSKFVALANR